MKYIFEYEKYDTDDVISTDQLKKLLSVVLTVGTGIKNTIIALVKIAAVCAIAIILEKRKKSDLEKKDQAYEIKHSASTATHLAGDSLDS